MRNDARMEDEFLVAPGQAKIMEKLRKKAEVPGGGWRDVSPGVSVPDYPRLRALGVLAARRHHAEQLIRAAVDPPAPRRPDLLQLYRESHEPHPHDVHVWDILAGR